MRIYNFSAGPAVLPEEVLREAQADLLEYKDSGMSVMEMSHRSKDFEDILFTAEKDLRDLLNVPEDYSVLFLQIIGRQFGMFATCIKRTRTTMGAIGLKAVIAHFFADGYKRT